jgi:glycosyltransferase involved in cell wall biosynthesis
MIRLLSVQPVAERGGSDYLLVRMLRSLPPDEFDCHVALPGPSPLGEEFAAAGAGLHTVPMERLSTSHGAGEWAGYVAGWPVAVGRLVRLIRRLRIDVVHSNSLHSLYGWAAAAITGRPHVWHAREIVVQSRAAMQLERFLAQHFAVKVVCMSQAIADQLYPGNVEVVYESVDPAEFRPELAGRFRDRVGIPDDAPLVGAVGRIDTWKGFDVLLDAFERAKGRRADLHLVVAGDAVTGSYDITGTETETGKSGDSTCPLIGNRAIGGGADITSTASALQLADTNASNGTGSFVSKTIVAFSGTLVNDVVTGQLTWKRLGNGTLSNNTSVTSTAAATMDVTLHK